MISLRLPLFLLLFAACTASPTAPSDAPHTVTLAVWQSDLEIGQEMQLTAIVRDREDSLVPNAALTWSTDLPAVATVSASGQLRGVSVGTVRVTVRAGGLSASRTVTIRRVRQYTLTLSAAGAEVRVGGTLRFAAVLHSDDGLLVQDPPVTWSVDPANVAQINTVGELLGVAPGVVTVTAVSTSYRATFPVTVVPVIPAVVAVTGGLRMLRPGVSTQLLAEVTSTDSFHLPATVVAWSTSDPTVVAVSVGGLVTAAGAGQATITATAGNARAQITMTVLGTPALLHQLTFLRTTGTETHIEVTTEAGMPLAIIQPSIALFGHGPMGEPTASMAPDGRTIAYDCTAGVCHLQLAGGGAASAYPILGVGLPSWNSDGSVLLLREGVMGIVQYGWEQDARQSRQLPRRLNLSRISPDGLSVLYECNANFATDWWDGALCLLDADGRSTVYKLQASAVSWSPWDGTLAYVRTDLWDDSVALVIEPLQDRPTPYDRGAKEYGGWWPSFGDFLGVTETAWSPDGQGLAVVKHGELWLFSMPTLTHPVRIAHVEGSRISSISWR